MNRNRFSEKDIIWVLKAQEAGTVTQNPDALLLQ